jgi:hypothetical protein
MVVCRRMRGGGGMYVVLHKCMDQVDFLSVCRCSVLSFFASCQELKIVELILIINEIKVVKIIKYRITPNKLRFLSNLTLEMVSDK